MKKNAWKIAVTVIVLAIVAACADGLNSPTAPSAAAPSGTALRAGARTVSGNALINHMPGVVYRMIINAGKTADGAVSGTTTVHLLDLSGIGQEDAKATLVGRVHCLEFAGDSVWFGVTIEASSDKSYLDPPLSEAIGQIRSANGVDYGFSGPALFYAPGGTTCTDRPILPIRPVTNGHYTIQ
jgi:hypothetical protein